MRADRGTKPCPKAYRPGRDSGAGVEVASAALCTWRTPSFGGRPRRRSAAPCATVVEERMDARVCPLPPTGPTRALLAPRRRRRCRRRPPGERAEVAGRGVLVQGCRGAGEGGLGVLGRQVGDA